MHNTTISMDNLNLSLCGMPQAMVFSINLSPEHPDHAFHGQLKSMQQASPGRMWLVICVGVGKQLLCEAQEWLVHEAAAAAEETDDVIADTAENGVHVDSMQMNCYM